MSFEIFYLKRWESADSGRAIVWKPFLWLPKRTGENYSLDIERIEGQIPPFFPARFSPFFATLGACLPPLGAAGAESDIFVCCLYVDTATNVMGPL